MSKPVIIKQQDHRGKPYLVMPHHDPESTKTGPIIRPETADKVRMRVERRQMEAVFRDNLSNAKRKKLGLPPIKKS